MRFNVKRIGTHKSTHAGGVITGAEVVEAALGVAFFASKMHRAGVATGASEGISEGEAGASLVGAAGCGAACAFGAEPGGVDEVGGAVGISGEVAGASVHFAAVPGA